MFGYENGLVFPIFFSNQKHEDSMDLLLLTVMINHIMCTLKNLIDPCFTKQKIKTKNDFVEAVYSILAVKMYWQNIKKID